MRKILIAALAASAIVPAAASAQSAREVRQDRREVSQDRREVRRDVARGNFDEARRDSRELREDRRELQEDWQDYRRTHRSEFRRDAYVAPRGLRYRPVAIGAQLNNRFYGRNYWLGDYGRYRLPRLGMNQQYVRYGNDVLLVNMRTGRVVRVYRDFFWR
jgi:Ni/Co efflux regulator RcnB